MAEPGESEKIDPASDATATANQARVFISYASHDASAAQNVCSALEGAGFPCWIAPRDVKAGAHYADAIVRAITSARALVLVLSESSIGSSHVGKEIERASSKNIPVIALRIDAAPLTPALEYFLSESQWVEAQAGNIKAANARLIDAIRETKQPTSGIVSVPSGTSVGTRSIRHKARRKWIIFAAGLAALAVVTLFADRFWLSKHLTTEQPAAGKSAASPIAPAISEKSIAVLAFVDMSEKKDQEYFSDGLSEELIDHLAQNVDLKVIARTSSFAFKGKNEDVRSIATKLGVANLLEGSVRKAGSGLRITAQLIRASDGVHLWSAIYDRKLSDIFKVQDEISTTVAKALNAALNGRPMGVQSPSPGTTNIEAYNLLLKGNYYFLRGNKGDEAKALEYIQKALNLVPQYAVAWAKLARIYVWQGFLGDLTAADAEIKVRDAVQRALTIDPNCAEAYFARGNMLRLLVGDWAAAESDYKSAAALDPHGEMGISAQGNILILRSQMSGQFDDRFDWARRELERNPLDTDTMSDLAWDQQLSGHLDDSASTARKLLELNPVYSGAQAQYGMTLLLMGKNLEALAAAEKESDDATKFQALACIYWAMGRRTESDSALGALEQGFANRTEYLVADAHACRGEADAAFASLDRAYRQRRGTLGYLKLDPLFRKLRSDPRFNAMLQQAKLVE
jgi:TolB-like protein/Flp pilus assembly protein TadD